MKIVLIQRLIPNYRQPVFEAIRARADRDGHAFEVWASVPGASFKSRGTGGTLPWAKSLPVRGLQQRWGGFEWQRLPWGELLSADVVIVPDNMRVFSNAVVLALRHLLGRPVLSWGHGVNFQPSRFSRAVLRLRLGLLGLADRNLVYTPGCATQLVARGIPANKIDVTHNAVDSTAAHGLTPEHPEVKTFRLAHELGDAPCVALLGSWYAQKRPELVLALGARLATARPGLRVLLIGGGESLPIFQKASPPWLVLLGPLTGRAKYVALCAARCLVVSGMGGLNVVDAMSVGLPVVVSRRLDHSPEVEYVEPERNGLVVEDSVTALAAACLSLCNNKELYSRLSRGALLTSNNLSVSLMSERIYGFARAAEQPAAARGVDVAMVHQRMLPYHKARYRALAAHLASLGKTSVAIEVASTDSSYGAHDQTDELLHADPAAGRVITLFKDACYNDLAAHQVARAVCQCLVSLDPETVFAPAPAFAEGAGALWHKVDHPSRLILMDDAWSATDHRGRLTRMVKQLFYKDMDGGFFPDPLHGEYFSHLNIPLWRQRYALNAVEDLDGTFLQPEALTDLIVPGQKFLLFVGRLVPRKNLRLVIEVLADMGPDAPLLVVIGDGPERAALEELATARGLQPKVHWLGRQDNVVARAFMRQALALVVPSDFEQWGLVVNEGWLAPTLVIGSATVGALHATVTSAVAWTTPPPGDRAQWRRALRRACCLSDQERTQMLAVGLEQASRYTLEKHVQSVGELLTVPTRPRTSRWTRLLSKCWRGRVATW